MKIPTNIKPKLNTLISYYRNLYSKTDERFMSKNFVYDDEGLEICTIYTLSRIEHNKTNSYDTIYYSLLDNLHMSYINEPKVDEIIHTVNLSLLKFAERNDSKSIIDRISKTLNILSPYLEYIFYKEQAEVYHILLDYYQDYKFNTELIDKHNELFDIVDEPLKPILIEISYNYYIRIKLNAEKSLDTLILVNRIKYDSIIKEYLVLLLTFRQYELSKEKNQANRLITRCKNENNKIYLCKAYNVLGSLYTKQNPELAYSYLQLAIDNFDKKLDSIQSLEIYYINISILACMNNKHKIAIINFDKLLSITDTIIFKIFPYYIYSLDNANQDKINIVNILIFLNRNKSQIRNSILIHILKLWQIKFNLISYTEINYILTNLLKSEEDLYEIIPLLNIIEYILYSICERNGNLKIYQDFMKNFH